MNGLKISRRELLKQGGAALAGLAILNNARRVPTALAQSGDEVIPWLDQPEPNPVPDAVGNLLDWEALDSWITPNDQFFYVSHYGLPEIDANQWRLEITGLVEHPMSLSLADLQAWPRQELTFTIECSGNHGFDWNFGLIGNARWAGVALAPLLQEAGVMDDGREVVFYGADSGEETVREQTISQKFARSMALEDALSPNNLLCYEMNGEPLPQPNGFPLRLIAPGWYGVANVKWLERIEVRSSRMMSRFMARDYVTLRQEEIDGEQVWTESSVGRSLLKSAPARVVRSGDSYRIEGTAWGAPIERVEVQIDDGPWQPATWDKQNTKYSWKLFTYDWKGATPGEHTIVSRVTGMDGQVQPTEKELETKKSFLEHNAQHVRRVMIA